MLNNISIVLLFYFYSLTYN